MPNPFFSIAELAERERFRQLGMENVRYSVPWFVRQQYPVYIFGAGRIAEFMAIPFLAGANIVGIIDNNPELWGRERFGFTVVSPSEAQRRKDNVIVVMAFNIAFHEAMAQCRAMGFECVTLSESWARSDSRRYREDLENLGAEAALGIWADRESYDVFVTSIRHLAGFHHPVPTKAPGYTYFQEFIPRSARRGVIDVGAFTGDTFQDFLLWSEGDFDSYIMFEPCEENLVALRQIATMDPRVTVIDEAAGEGSGSIAMTYSGGILAAKSGGEFIIKETALDDVLSGKRATFIKMDIEGSELAALRGAEKTIRDQRPVLAISVYHEPEHFWTIPLWINNLNLGYSLLLRQHYNVMPWDTVCYAIPKP